MSEFVAAATPHVAVAAPHLQACGPLSFICDPVVDVWHGVSDTGKLINMVGGIIGEIVKLFTKPGSFFYDIGHWIIQFFFPKELQAWFFGGLGFGTHAPDVTAYQNLYNAMVPIGIAVAVCAAGARILRTMLDVRATNMNVMLDSLVRFAVVMAFLAPVHGQSLGYLVMSWALQMSWLLCSAIATQMISHAIFSGHSALGLAGQLLNFLLGSFVGGGGVLAGLVVLPIVVMLMYAVVMLIIRGLMLGFCVATAPFCIATAAFDTRNKFFAWWWDLFTGSLAIAPILTLCFWVTTVMALPIGGMPIIGPLLDGIVFCGGIWMAGKIIHQLSWKHFSHGGALCAFGAATGVLAAGAKVGFFGQLATKPGTAAHSFFAKMGAVGTTLGMGFPSERAGMGAGGLFGGGKGGKIAGLGGALPGGGSLSSDMEDALEHAGGELVNGGGEYSQKASDFLQTPASQGGGGMSPQAVLDAKKNGQLGQAYYNALSRSSSPAAAQARSELAMAAFSGMLGAKVGAPTPWGASNGGGGGGDEDGDEGGADGGGSGSAPRPRKYSAPRAPQRPQDFIDPRGSGQPSFGGSRPANNRYFPPEQIYGD